MEGSPTERRTPARARGVGRPTRRRGAWLLLAALLAAATASAGSVLEGRVVRIFDGDTIEVLVDGEPRRIRLAGIDAPERGQPWGERSRQALARRVFGKPVRINEVTVDRYGRTVGEVYADDVCVGCELVREGHARVYRRYSDDEVLLGLEAEARAARRGLWGLPEGQQVEPEAWRRSRSGASGGRTRAAPAGEPDASDFACGSRRTCGQMRSCAEARFHFERCGLDRLDGDRDGVPCEKLCRGGR